MVRLRALKGAVRCRDPQYSRPENIPITRDMKDAVGPAHAKYAKYLQRIEEEKAEESNKVDGIRKQREEETREQKER
mgnify:FL=1